MKHGSLSRIFWGLFLLFFNINFFNLNLITTFIGALLVATALWQLRQENISFKNAFICSIIQLSTETAGFVFLCAQISGYNAASIVLTAVGVVNMIALIFNLFSGLRLLAVAVGQDELGSKLQHCYVLYFLLSVFIILSMAIPLLVYIVFFAALIIFIYILVQVSRVNKVIGGSTDPYSEKELNGRYFTMLAGYLGLVILVCLTVLILKNCPAVHTEIYNRADSGIKLDSESIKRKMLKLGFEKEILSDLPESEISNYKNCLALQNRADKKAVDGGILKITQCTASFKGGIIRFLFYYKWIKLPVNQFCDKLSIGLYSGFFTITGDMRFNGFGLYDMKTEKGLSTYRADFIKNESSEAAVETVTPLVVYRVFGRDKNNQRGFFAYNAQVSDLSDGMTYETTIDYYHQKSLFNFGNGSNSNTANTSQQQMFGNDHPYGFAFNDYQFYTAQKYKMIKAKK